MIKEVIIVEGKNDESAVKKATDAEVIAINGFGISQKTWKRIEKAYFTTGIIIFTDPDFAGEKIRKRLSERFPESKHAYLSKEAASKNSDIGIENASPSNIMEALKKAKCVVNPKRSEFTTEDMLRFGLTGKKDSAALRNEIGIKLGIGYGNKTAFLNRLNHYGISREEFESACLSVIMPKEEK